MRRTLLLLGLLLLPVATAAAAPDALTYRSGHFLFSIRLSPSWRTTEKIWMYQGKPFDPPPALLVDGDDLPPLPPGVSVAERDTWNVDAIRASLEDLIGKPFHRDPGSVVIRRSATGSVAFEGVGLTGRDIDARKAAELTVRALEDGITDIVLPVFETQPQIRMEDPSLLEQGIKEVVAVGESDFSNSPTNRRHNIAVGLRRFNGHLIPQGATFSFDETLGPVDGTTGYRKELVIKGAKTEPDYGGGLCQVSTTAYRGVWEYGFPILKRVNHSYMVSHYSPQGTDATVFPPNVDMQFRNDSSGALLIQTYAKDNLAYFIYYGTRDGRRSELVGPFNWGRTAPPPDRTEPTLDLPPGGRKKVGERVPGMKTLWYRFIVTGDAPEKMESFYSAYEARPHYELVGVEKLPEKTGSGMVMPTVFTEDQVVPAGE